MPRHKQCPLRSTRNAPQVSPASQSTWLGPYPHSHACSTSSDSYPQVRAPSPFMAELYAMAGPSDSQRSAYREKRSRFASRTSRYEARYFGSIDAARSSSSPERNIPRKFGIEYQIANPSSSAHRSHANNGNPLVGSRRDSEHLRGEGRPSGHGLPQFDSRAGAAFGNCGSFEPIDYISAWQDSLRPATSLNASSANRGAPTGAPTLATGLPKTRQ